MWTPVSSREAVFAWLRGKVDGLTDNTKQVVRELADEGADITRHHIETRGTAKSGKRGRIETGAMLNSVDSKVTKDSGDEFEARFGYMDGPFYTVFQEQGTKAIEAMNALGDAADEIHGKLEAAIGDAIRRS